MQKITAIFVIGANATGKTHFIKEHFANQELNILNVYDYQQQAYAESGYKKHVPLQAEYECLLQANKMLLADIIEIHRQSFPIVLETMLTAEELKHGGGLRRNQTV